jgi:hypothetical protein
VPVKKGRPAGSKDKAPRKKTIVEQPLPGPEPVLPVAPVATPPPPEPEEQPSPRVLLRQAAENIVHLRQLTKAKHKTKLQEAYTAKLHSLAH